MVNSGLKGLKQVSRLASMINNIKYHVTPQSADRVGVNSGIEWELSSIPDLIPGIGLGIGIEKKKLEINWNGQKMPGIDK